MASFGEEEIMTFQASGDLSSSQYRAVDLTTTSAQAQLPSSSGDPVVGVLENDPTTTGAEAEVRINGVAKVEAGASVSTMDAIKANASGQAVSTDPTTTTTSHYAFGVALSSAASSGVLIPVLITHDGQVQ